MRQEEGSGERRRQDDEAIVFDPPRESIARREQVERLSNAKILRGKGGGHARVHPRIENDRDSGLADSIDMCIQGVIPADQAHALGF